MEKSISRPQFITWFKNTFILSYEDGLVTIGVPNGFAKEWLENKFNSFILRSLKSLDPKIKSIHCLIIAAPPKSTSFQNSVSHSIYPQKPTLTNSQNFSNSNEANLNPRYSFDNFIVGANNELARAACYAVSHGGGHEQTSVDCDGRRRR